MSSGGEPKHDLERGGEEAANDDPGRLSCFVSVVVPLRDDAAIVEAFVTELFTVLERCYAHHELVLVDDGSSDDTVARVQALLSSRDNIRLLCLSRRFGQETAISAGLDSVIGDFVVVMLPDIDPPANLPDMVETSRGGADVVYGIRRHRRDEHWWQRAGVRAFYWCVNSLLDLHIPRNVTHYRVFSRQAVNAVIQIRDHSRYLATLSAYVGFRSAEYAYDPISRRDVPRRKSLGQSLALAAEIIVSNSIRPLRLASAGCLAVAVLYPLSVAGWSVVEASRGQLLGLGWWASAGFVATLMLVLAVLCEYVGRLYAESHARPLYYVQRELVSSVLEAGASAPNVVERSELPIFRAS